MPRPGLLYDIVGESLCSEVIFILCYLTVFLLIFYLRVIPFREKPSLQPQTAVQPTVVSKEIVSVTHRTGRSQMGCSFVVRFLTNMGQTLELYAYEEEFGGLKEGVTGLLTCRGRYFVDFK